ncbi:uncharacterized protein LOC141690645 [Apium graveolens]|uniref:uncharacterized protein LOC141690645 n=1 Tax=Apium graveolens TaxID=4045 RepID=UPI003D7B84D7
MQLEKEKLLAKSRSKRTRRDPTSELISDDEEEEKRKDLKDMIYKLQRKMDRDSGVEIGETLTPFSHSLEETINKVSSLDVREALSILRRNLDPEHNERYIVELINNEPQSLAAAYSMAARFIKETDMLQESKSDPGPVKQPREPKQEPDWTHLNMTREEILKEVKDKPLYYPPKPMQTPPESRPYNRQCDYHEIHGHKTKNCLSLKYFIDDQVKKGNMNKYLVRDNNNRGKAEKRGKNVVNVVLGGSHSPPRSPDVGEEVLSIQSLPDLVISFSSKDYEGLNPHHNAALVVTLDIFDNEVRRMLIDNGSSVNILFKHTMDRMHLGNVRSNKCREDPLYGFGHNLVPIQGTLYLPVIFGTTPNQVTHVIKFYVINAPSSYNGIIGSSRLFSPRLPCMSDMYLALLFPRAAADK